MLDVHGNGSGQGTVNVWIKEGGEVCIRELTLDRLLKMLESLQDVNVGIGVEPLPCSRMGIEVNEVKYSPIGIIHSSIKEPQGTPTQPTSTQGLEGTVEIFPEYTKGFENIDGFSYIILTYHFHLPKKSPSRTKPYMDDEPRGVFATCTPLRPNPIGVSIVRLVRVKENTLHVRDVDIVDGTSLLDVKPYVPDVIGWLEERIGKFPYSQKAMNKSETK